MTRFIFKNNSGRRIEDEYEQESGNREANYEGCSSVIDEEYQGFVPSRGNQAGTTIIHIRKYPRKTGRLKWNQLQVLHS